MAVLKYKDENGNYQPIVGVNVQNEVVQITGQSTVAVMSQKAVTDELANEKHGNGIGTCSTSSGTALTVSLTGYELVQNGIVAVTFENDVPANATLNINGKGAKSIYYKGAAIEADTIKAGDTAMFSYDGTNYILCSSGAGGGSTDIIYDTTNKKITKTVNGVTSDVVTAAKIVEDGAKETVKISLTQIGGNAADLIGATVTVKDDNTSEVIYSGTWNGSIITTQVTTMVQYTISAGSVTGYMDCPDQSYYAGFGERIIEFKYRGNGVFIEDTNGLLYTSSTWDNSKTANSIVIISDSFKRRMALSLVGGDIAPASITYNLTNHTTEADAKTDFNGKDNSATMIATYDGGAVALCTNFTSPDGTTKGYMPALGELWSIYQNSTEVNACLLACKGSGLPGRTWTSTKKGTGSTGQFWYIWMTDGTVGSHDQVIGFGTIPIAEYE